MNIRRLIPADASIFQSLRLAGLQEAPFAFSSSYEEEKDIPMAAIENRLALKPDCGSFGAFENNTLVGHVALGREGQSKLSHKRIIWGMYVVPDFRGKGVARLLLIKALSLARSVSSVKQVNLSVNAGNACALHLYESVGFKVFGHEPGALFVNGELCDEIHMFLRL